MKKLLLLGFVSFCFGCLELPPVPPEDVYVDVQLAHNYSAPVVMQLTNGRITATDWTHNLAPTNATIVFSRTDVDQELKISFTEPLNVLHLKKYSIPTGTYDITIDTNSESISEYVFITGYASGIIVTETSNPVIDIIASTTQYLILLKKENLDLAIAPILTFNNSPGAYFDSTDYFYVYSTRTSFKTEYALLNVVDIVAVSVNPTQSDSIYLLNSSSTNPTGGGFKIDMTTLFNTTIQI